MEWNLSTDVVVVGAGGATISEVEKPEPKAAQLLIKVRACGLNRADLGMTRYQASALLTFQFNKQAIRSLVLAANDDNLRKAA